MKKLERTLFILITFCSLMSEARPHDQRDHSGRYAPPAYSASVRQLGATGGYSFIRLDGSTVGQGHNNTFIVRNVGSSKNT